MVNTVEPGGPASRAGLRGGDVILGARGRELPDSRAVARAVAMSPIGEVLKLDIWRDARRQTIPVVVAEWPGDRQQTAIRPVPRPPMPPELGLQLSTIADAYRAYYRLPADLQGVLVTGVSPLTPADDRGLRTGDVIMSMQAAPVTSPADVLQRLASLRQDGRRYVLVLVWRGNATRTVALPLSEG
jgi:serine protease Do